jgi:hypothetical protein
MLRDQPRYQQPTASLAATASDLEHPHAFACMSRSVIDASSHDPPCQQDACDPNLIPLTKWFEPPDPRLADRRQHAIITKGYGRFFSRL